MRGKKSPNSAQAIQQAFSVTKDPTAKTAAAAEARFVQLVTSGPLKLSVAQLVADDPISGYCTAVFPAAYFAGSGLVSSACAAAFTTLTNSGPRASLEQQVVMQRGTLTACRSQAEWLHAAKRSTIAVLNRVGERHSPNAATLLKTLCAPNRTTPACRGR